MNSLLSALSGQFSKSLLLSTLLPVAVFVLIGLVLVLPGIPATFPVIHWVQGLDAEWKLAAVTLAVVLLTALLHNLNGPIIRVYEGYPWCDSWVGRFLTSVHRRRMIRVKNQYDGLWTLLVDPAARARPDYPKVKDYWNDLARKLNDRYPDEPEAVLPTRFGNVVRSFESYSWRQYKMRAITLWPRLVAQLDESYAGLIDASKSSLDFMLNASLLCALLAFLVLAVHLAFPVGLATAEVLVPFAIELAVLGGLAYAFYLAAIPRAGSWGVAVKGAFDLYRGKLLERLGYRDQPGSLKEERVLWEKISERLILSDLTIEPLPPYARSKTAANSSRAKVRDLPFSQGMRRLTTAILEVTLEVRNPDTRLAPGVVITDTVPDGWAYEWGSAIASSGAVEVTGANPYHFKVADLAAGAATQVTYRAVSAAPPIVE